MTNPNEISNIIRKQIEDYSTDLNIDIIGNLAKDGNWYHNLKTDFDILGKLNFHSSKHISIIEVNSTNYQNAGANSVQQVAYALAHGNEYLNFLSDNNIKYSSFNFKFSFGSNYFFEIAKQIEIFTTLFKELNMNYVDDTNPGDLMDNAIKNMLNELDPYTRFYNEQDVEAERIKRTGDYTGVGASIRTLKDKLVVIEPYKGYPADKAGLKAGDEIIIFSSNDATSRRTFIYDGKFLTENNVNSTIIKEAVGF